MSSFQLPPLLNPVILENIFRKEKWSFSDLKNIRLVCKLWHDTTFDLWRSTATIVLFDNFQSFGTTSSGSRGGLLIAEFLTRLKKKDSCESDHDHDDHLKLQEKPFTRYRLSQCTINTNEYREEPTDFIFWHNVGPIMKYLHFDHCKFASLRGHSYREVIYNRARNLQSLVFTNPSPDMTKMKVTRFTRPTVYPNSLKLFHQPATELRSLEVTGDIPCEHSYDQILESFPNLETFKLETVLVPISLFQDCDPTEYKIHYSKIKHLDLTNQNVYEHSDVGLWHLLDRGVSVPPLKLETYSLEMGNYMFNDILHAFHETLKIFRGYRYPFRKIPPLVTGGDMRALRPFPNLREIHLWGPVTDTLEFLRRMPNLRVIHLDYSFYEKRKELAKPLFRLTNNNAAHEKWQKFQTDIVKKAVDRFDMSSVLLNDLTKLHVDFQFSVDSLRILKRWMPNIKNLGLVLNNDTFREVCYQWRDLRELTILFGGQVDDHGITGGGPGSPLDLSVAAANITDLKHLTKFVHQTYCDQAKLTDWSVYHENGFLKLECLHTLHICVSPEFSQDAEAHLKDKICQVRVIRNYGEGRHSDIDCCARVLYNKIYVDSSTNTTNSSLSSRMKNLGI